MLMDRDQIARMIPHKGTMCLLDAVLHWDAETITCVTQRYRDADNPLRRADGTLGTACGIEIAAQAMAVHGRLTAGVSGQPKNGFLASLRDVRLRTTYLDGLAGTLMVNAKLLMGDHTGASYGFMLEHEGVEILIGRATVLSEPSA